MPIPPDDWILAHERVPTDEITREIILLDKRQREFMDASSLSTQEAEDAAREARAAAQEATDTVASLQATLAAMQAAIMSATATVSSLQTSVGGLVTALADTDAKADSAKNQAEATSAVFGIEDTGPVIRCGDMVADLGAVPPRAGKQLIIMGRTTGAGGVPDIDDPDPEAYRGPAWYFGDSLIRGTGHCFSSKVFVRFSASGAGTATANFYGYNSDSYTQNSGMVRTDTNTRIGVWNPRQFDPTYFSATFFARVLSVTSGTWYFDDEGGGQSFEVGVTKVLGGFVGAHCDSGSFPCHMDVMMWMIC